MRKYKVNREDVRVCKVRGYSIIKCGGKMFIVDYYSGYSNDKIKLEKFLPPLKGMELSENSAKEIVKSSKGLTSSNKSTGVICLSIIISKLLDSLFNINQDVIDIFYIKTELCVSIVILFCLVVFVYIVTQKFNANRYNKLRKNLNEDIVFDCELLFETNVDEIRKGKSNVLMYKIVVFIFYWAGLLCFLDLDNYFGLILIVIATYLLINPTRMIVPKFMDITINKL